MTTEEPEVLTSRTGRLGLLTLNRPRALNALNHRMVHALSATLRAWAADPDVATVAITGAGERGLCAGGDIRAIHADATSGAPDAGVAAAAFWRDEYRLNARIARYPKPYVALMDGIVMGGGVGLSAHGTLRVVTERSRVAMPETGIGFAPDVGGTWLLARAPGELGTHLALTGAEMTAGDAVHCGFADHFAPADALPALLADLARLPAAEAVAAHARPVPAGELAAERPWIDACYAADTVEEILDRLAARPEPAARRAAATLATRSPTSLKVTLAAVRLARRLGGLEEALEREYWISRALLASPDLAEGVRAQVVDKDRNPRWRPATLADVGAADVARYLAAPEPDDGLGLGLT
ncbi:enoyl-CoA hydratase/isomerase family protein [Streptomyces sp. 3MP-14]|uniref:3-hydroxyisobutyryl-CoA hydrolase n=1 Tax=Streptomyces mimosae TaxID=2586635 RepID=A0A5N5ZZL0_9ACTN|nr:MULTISPECIES: enoyl-CoA hydratase/isomerase family protein [Streptomyces]KAB8161927.1 enoyl-CoA hydratase/isomerase family protein [Streptomyces mimosae]KAB8173625.1 enoyl-CoA hydratase/isomerase family protein [Streptomyces sp. 3MP-14]